VQRAVAILGELADARAELGTNEIARRTGINVSTISRILATLVSGGLVEHVAATGRYRHRLAFPVFHAVQREAVVAGRVHAFQLVASGKTVLDLDFHEAELPHPERVYSDFTGIRADPKNKDVLYIANTSTYRSLDGGKSFTAIKGAPGGDDYQSIWINPDNPQIILLSSDQGAVVTVNGGQTWSSWYNQPTAQFYHVITDNQFPYWVYGGQQESGSAGVCSRGPLGQITFRDWQTVGVEVGEDR